MEAEAEAEAKKILKMEAEAEAVQKFGASTSLVSAIGSLQKIPSNEVLLTRLVLFQINDPALL